MTALSDLLDGTDKLDEALAMLDLVYMAACGDKLASIAAGVNRATDLLTEAQSLFETCRNTLRQQDQSAA